MSGFFRLGTVALASGLMLMIAAPDSARAITTINVVNQNILFPEGVLGEPAPAEGDSIVAFDQLFNFGVFVRSSDETADGENGDGTVAGDAPLDVQVEIAQGFQLRRTQGETVQDGQDSVGLQPRETSGGGSGVVGVRPRVSVGGDDVVESRPRELIDTEETVGTPTRQPTPVEETAEEAVAGGSTVTRSPGGAVTTAPEPATWIMMICGFWIVAWRLRHGRRACRDALATPA